MSARGELFQNVLLKSSQLILSMKERGQKGAKWNFQLKDGFILLSPSTLKQQHSISQMIQTSSASSCRKMSQLDDVLDRPQLKPQQLNRALYVFNSSVFIFDLHLPGGRIGVCSAPEQTLVTELPSTNLFSFTHSCHWNVTEEESAAYCYCLLYVSLVY